MSTYLAGRLVQLVPMLVITSFLVFALLRFVPGDPAAMLAGLDASPEQVAAVQEELGLDQPLLVQYVRWAGNVLRGDFGHSFIKRRPVMELIEAALPATLELTASALLLAILLGVPLGLIGGMRPHSTWDLGVSTYTALALGLPGFLLAIGLLLAFSLALGWLPAAGRVSLAEDPATACKYLVLPAVALALPSAAVYARFVRNALREVLGTDYVRTARAKGLRERAVILGHGLRNALLPLVTVLGVQVGHVVGGAVVIESIFAWPGMGRLMLDAIRGRDYVVVQGALLLLVLAVVLVNLLTDLLYGVLDPRVRLAG
jgi:ABC-type dipeptide/oligopeptide/nickel transport system permease component